MCDLFPVLLECSTYYRPSEEIAFLVILTQIYCGNSTVHLVNDDVGDSLSKLLSKLPVMCHYSLGQTYEIMTSNYDNCHYSNEKKYTISSFISTYITVQTYGRLLYNHENQVHMLSKLTFSW